MTAPIARMTSDLLREMREPAPTIADALRQIVALCEAKDCPSLDDPTDFAIASSRGHRLARIKSNATAALAAADAASQPPADERAEALLRRCLDGFSAYIHGRKLAKAQRDRLREDLQDYLGRRASLAQPPAAPAVAGEVAMPALDIQRSLGLDAVRYVAGWPESYVKEYARAYGDARATAALARVPLSEEQIVEIEERIWDSEFFDDTELQSNREFVRAIERAHGILPAPTEGGA